MSLEVIHKSLHRPVFFLGVDRELGMSVILICFITGFGGYNLISLIAALVFWSVAMHYLRKWTKADPLIREVFLRHHKYIKNGGELFLARPGVFNTGPLYLWRRKSD